MSENNQQKNNTESDLNEVLKIRREKLAVLQESGANPFEITSYERTDMAGDIKENYADFEGKVVSIAGRLMSKRVMGKCRLQIWQIEAEGFSFVLSVTNWETTNIRYIRNMI